MIPQSITGRPLASGQDRMLQTLNTLTATLLLAIPMLASAPKIHASEANTRASEFTLSNGMQVVVIPDHRSPVVTHMVW